MQSINLRAYELWVEKSREGGGGETHGRISGRRRKPTIIEQCGEGKGAIPKRSVSFEKMGINGY